MGHAPSGYPPPTRYLTFPSLMVEAEFPCASRCQLVASSLPLAATAGADFGWRMMARGSADPSTANAAAPRNTSRKPAERVAASVWAPNAPTRATNTAISAEMPMPLPSRCAVFICPAQQQEAVNDQ